MKRAILNIGKELNKKEQKSISGGWGSVPHIVEDPGSGDGYLTGSWIDDGSFDCNWPYVSEHGVCRHVCSSSYRHMHEFCN